MPAPDAAIAEAIRHIREIALREAMAMCYRMQPRAEDFPDPIPPFRLGYQYARMQLYDEIERMIAREVPAPATPAGYFTSDGIEDP